MRSRVRLPQCVPYWPTRVYAVSRFHLFPVHHQGCRLTVSNIAIFCRTFLHIHYDVFALVCRPALLSRSFKLAQRTLQVHTFPMFT